MWKIGRICLTALLSTSAIAFCTGLSALAQPVETLPINHPIDVQGVRMACTGIGLRAEHNRRWSHFPVKLEMVNRRGNYLANENVTLFDHDAGAPIQVRCDAPWVLMQLPAGRYEAKVNLMNKGSEKVMFNAPRAGQSDVIVRFAT